MAPFNRDSDSTWFNDNISDRKTFTNEFKIKKKIKELSFCHKLGFSNYNIVGTQCRRPLIFQTMNAIRSNNVCLKYQKFTS